MKLLVLLVVAVGYMEVSTQGDIGILTPDLLDWGIGKRSSSHSKRSEADLDFNGDPTGDTYVRNMLKLVFSMPQWRNVMVMFATPEELSDPDFLAKWQITDNDITSAGQLKHRGEVREKLRGLLRSGKWRGLIALSSTKDELTNLKYREKWGLGTLYRTIGISSESGNFFYGPQWKQFLAITNKKNVFADPQARAKWLRTWILNAMLMLNEL